MNMVERFDWIAHYKAVQTRIALAPKQKKEPARIRLGCVRYDEPIGPIRVVFVPPAGLETMKPRANGRAILAQVAREFSIPVETLIGPRRFRSIMAARMKAYYRLRAEAGLSFPQISKLMGGRDHTSAVHGYYKFKQALDEGRVIL